MRLLPRVKDVFAVALLAFGFCWSLGHQSPDGKRVSSGFLIRPRSVMETAMWSSGRLAVITLLASIWFRNSSVMIGQDTAIGETVRAAETCGNVPILRQRVVDGDSRTAYELGRCYMNGIGVAQNYENAATWYRRAAERGLPDANFMMGYLYEHGKGVGRDYKQAVTYYMAAAKQGHATAQNNLASMYEHGEGVAKNIREAAEWYRAAAKQGEVTAQCNLASLYFKGRGVSQDNVQAVAWFRAAAERGYAPAQENLAWMYYTGTGVDLDYVEAANWVRQAAEREYAPAELDLGYLYEQGRGVPLDYVSAYIWYSSAVKKGERSGQERLKELTRLMTRQQISTAVARVAELPPATKAIQSEDRSSATQSIFPKRP